jgi:hypothetical protein
VSSTVTTATVSTVTAAITVEGLGQVFSLVAVAMLLVVLLAREVIAGSSHQAARTLARGLDISIAPLLTVFVVSLALNLSTLFG